jgi:protein tyrosine/serine phosphatase
MLLLRNSYQALSSYNRTVPLQIHTTQTVIDYKSQGPMNRSLDTFTTHILIYHSNVDHFRIALSKQSTLITYTESILNLSQIQSALCHHVLFEVQQ